MKKLFKLGLALFATMALAACGGNGGDGGHTVELKDWYLTGPDVITVNGKKASESGGKEWGYGGEAFGLTKIDVAAAKEIDADIGGALEAKGAAVKAVYKLEGVGLGLGANPNKVKFKADDGKIYETNQSYCIKFVKVAYDEEDDVYSASNWVSDPHTAHVEGLKNIFYPTWQEAADEDGFEWNQNPVVTGGAGIYTVIFAQYTTASTAETCGYGVGLHLTEDKSSDPNAQPYTEYEAPEYDSWGVVGSMTGWGSAAGTDLAMTPNADYSVYTLDHAFAADDEFKIRANETWSGDLGFGAVKLESSATGAFVNADAEGKASGNIKCVTAGNYHLVFTVATSELAISLVA